MSEAPALTARSLVKLYEGRAALQQLDLTVERGIALGLLGANGAGKTTLLKSLLGLVEVDGGRCTLLGEASTGLSPATRAAVGYVPQSPNQFAWLTGLGMLRYVAEFYPGFDWEYAHGLVERWKIALDAPIGTLSPGQQQRLSIVRALGPRPTVMILDEPIASLDPATRIAVIDELLAVQRERSMTIVFSSHLIGDLERLCSRFAIVAAGKIAVLDEAEWFHSLVRVRLDGEEQVLSALPIATAVAVRKPGDGQRIAVLPRSARERFAASLPASIRCEDQESSLEAVASEWMQ